MNKEQIEQKKYLYRVYKTVISMLYNRGYEGPQLLSFDTFCSMSKEQLTMIATLRPEIKPKRDPETAEKIIVFFLEEERPGIKLGVKPIRNYYDRMVNLDITKGILIVKENITSFARNEIVSFSRAKENPVFIEIFLESSLVFDITTHELQPKFELLSLDEKASFLESLNTKETHIAKILLTDPIVKYYDFKERDIIKITRPSETGGSYCNYRIVL